MRATSLGDLLGALHRDGATGILELIECSGVSAGRSHQIHLDRGLVTRAETALGGERLGKVLHRRGAIDEFLLDEVGLLAESSGRKLGEMLIDHGVTNTTAVLSALREQLSMRLEALFRLRDAAVRFHVARPATGLGAQVIPLVPREFLHGRPRKRDEPSASREPSRSGDCARPEDVRSRAQAPFPETPWGDHLQERRSDPARTRALKTLGLPATAQGAEIRRAFRRLAAETHPDRFPAAAPEQRRQLLHRLTELSVAYHRLVG